MVVAFDPAVLTSRCAHSSANLGRACRRSLPRWRTVASSGQATSNRLNARVGTVGDLYNAFELSPVPAPGPDAVAPDLFRGIYGMPAFVTIPTRDLAESVDFWVHGLGFFELFRIPGRLVHLRRWAFQDVLLVLSATVPVEPPAISVNFACVLSQVDSLVAACRALNPGSVSDPRDTPWNTRDVRITTPENASIVFTAAKRLDPMSQEARNLEAVGIVPPDTQT
jgi:catechol 2,3-dioxygenase-like lactoylglutathione lyase family enzyme